MLWECFSAAKYREILEDDLIQSARELRLGRRFIFQQDNDLKYTGKHRTQKCFKDKKVNVLEWPSQSPDLKPIENCLDLKGAFHA